MPTKTTEMNESILDTSQKLQKSSWTIFAIILYTQITSNETGPNGLVVVSRLKKPSVSYESILKRHGRQRPHEIRASGWSVTNTSLRFMRAVGGWMDGDGMGIGRVGGGHSTLSPGGGGRGVRGVLDTKKRRGKKPTDVSATWNLPPSSPSLPPLFSRHCA
jgi:hypothetical protein